MSNIVRPIYKQVSTVTGYKTSDGKVFEIKEDADKWQHKVNRYDEICYYFKGKLFKWEELNPNTSIIHREVIGQVLEGLFFDLDLYDAECFLARTREKYDKKQQI